MACTDRQNYELQQKCKKIVQTTDDPVEKLRATVFSRLGAKGIKALACRFKIMDDDGSRSLDFKEMKKAVTELGLSYADKELRQVFNKFDRDGSGTIDFDEFLLSMRPTMNQGRLNLVAAAFTKLDRTGDGVVTIEDLKGVYDVSKHPKFLNGEWTEERCFRTFLDSFDTKNNADGVITREEFENYYAGVSASIDNDAYFNLMMKSAWRV